MKIYEKSPILCRRAPKGFFLGWGGVISGAFIWALFFIHLVEGVYLGFKAWIMITSPKDFGRKMGYLENIECGCFSFGRGGETKPRVLADSVFVNKRS